MADDRCFACSLEGQQPSLPTKVLRNTAQAFVEVGPAMKKTTASAACSYPDFTQLDHNAILYSAWLRVCGCVRRVTNSMDIETQILLVSFASQRSRVRV